jgi:hypothetical protein
MSQVHTALGQIEARSLSLESPDAEHWLLAFVEGLPGHFRSSGDITFEAVQRQLQLHEQAFLADLKTARRMYRAYPHLFKAEKPAAHAKAAHA